MLINFLSLLYMLCPTVLSQQNVVTHDFHLSKCEVNYNHEESALQIALRIFIDDLELTMTNEMGVSDLKLCTEKESEDAESLISQYVANHMKITIDGQDQQLKWVGKEPSEDLAAVWIYLEIPEIHPQKEITVFNDILIDTYDDQQNIIKLIYSSTAKAFYLFHKGDVQGTLNL